eukprot:m51a1_g14395 putative probable atp-dependent rna helicase ddx46 (1222) ;mRNA; r:342551-347099
MPRDDKDRKRRRSSSPSSSSPSPSRDSSSRRRHSSSRRPDDRKRPRRSKSRSRSRDRDRKGRHSSAHRHAHRHRGADGQPAADPQAPSPAPTPAAKTPASPAAAPAAATTAAAAAPVMPAQQEAVTPTQAPAVKKEDGEGETPEERARREAREAEQKALDEEVQRRRERVEQWRRERERRAAEAAAAAAAEAQEQGDAGEGEGMAAEEDEEALEDAADELDLKGRGRTARSTTPHAAAPDDAPDLSAPQQHPQSTPSDPGAPEERVRRRALGSVPAAQAARIQEAMSRIMTEVQSETAAAAAAAAADEDPDDELARYMATIEGQAQAEVAETRQKIASLGLESSSESHRAGAAASSSSPATATATAASTREETSRRAARRLFLGGIGGEDEEEPPAAGSEDERGGAGSSSSDDDDRPSALKKKKKSLRLLEVDHSKIAYQPFRADFYIEVPEIARLSIEDVIRVRREELDGCVVHGKACPKPISTWAQCGFSPKILDILMRVLKFEKPTPIQRQAIPAVLAGRDVIACARTGSGKTLAYALPMLRHVMDQRPLQPGDGPIALAVAPTRELAIQISSDIKKFTKFLGLQCVSVYGGAGIADQIGELKRGAEIVVCTPGRMIDVLVSNAGRITNLRRVTFIILDEADRMFDMGFEPQVMRIVECVRPDRQTVMFSATFPYAVEQAARKILRKPLELICGGRGVACKDVEQHVELHPDDDSKFRRLLELMRDWYERGQILIFVQRQVEADKLFQELLGANYPCLVLHAGVDQKDRASTIADFRRGEKTVLVATSIASRGLDVKGLELVVNYDVPNHLEDYVHRIGRTGRAGRKGTAFTFLTPDDERHAPDIVKALTISEQPVPEDLRELAEAFEAKRREAAAQGRNIAPGSGFGGKGFMFSESEVGSRDERRRVQRVLHAMEDGSDSDSSSSEGPGDGADSDDDGAPMPAMQTSFLPTTLAGGPAVAQIAQGPALLPLPPASLVSPGALVVAGGSLQQQQQQAQALQLQQQQQMMSGAPLLSTPIAAVAAGIAPALAMPPAAAAVASALAAVGVQSAGAPLVPPAVAAAAAMPESIEAATRAALFAQELNRLQAEAMMLQAAAAQQQQGAAGAQKQQAQQPEHYEAEIEINDYPQQARWKVTHKDALTAISEYTGAAVTTRGMFVPPGRTAPPGERKLYLVIEAPTSDSVHKAKKEIKRILEENSLLIHPDALRLGGGGRYSVL